MMSNPGRPSTIKLNPDHENIMTMAIGSDIADSAVRDPALNTIATSIGNVNNHGKVSNGIQANAIGSDKQGTFEGNLNVNNILTEADNAAIAALTIALAPGTITGTANTVSAGGDINAINSTVDTNSIQNVMAGPPPANSTASNSVVGICNSHNANPHTTPNIATNSTPEVFLDAKNSNTPATPTNMSNANNTTSNMNLNQYILASAGVQPTSLQTNAALPMPSPPQNSLSANVACTGTNGNVDGNSSNGSVSNTINNNQHFQSAILQQNAAIMRQNAATLQQLQSLQQTNKLLAANPEAAATLGMLAPIMNMNFATTNPVQLLATATPISLGNNCGTTNTSASILPPATTALQTTATNLPEVDGVSTITTVSTNAHQGQPQQNQQHGIPVPSQPGTIAIAQGGSQMFPGVGISNSMNLNAGSVANSNNGVVDGVNNTNNDTVQNILRTALLLQNSGLPFLQQGIIPQQQQIIPATAGAGFMLVPSNNANNNNIPLGIVPICAPANNNVTPDNSGGSNESNSKRNYSISSDVSNNGGGGTSGAAAAANAAASVLPPASMNLPLQQHLQQQQSTSSFIPQMGIDLTGSNNNNAMALLGGAALNNNNINSGSNINSNSLQIAGLASLQQQQRLQTMTYAPTNPSQSHSQLALPSPQQQKQQQPSLGNTLNSPPDPRTTTTTQLKLQQSQPKRKQTSIHRPLYLDHDSNCLTAYQCFLRKQIELFEVGHDEMTGTAQGRNTPLQYGQVGIRCRHCAHLPKATRARGGVYYSRTIDGVYQVAQNMSKLHFLKACTLIPESTKNQLKSLQSVSSRASGGKEYWAEGLRVLGIVEVGGMLRFASSSSSPSSTQISKPSK